MKKITVFLALVVFAVFILAYALNFDVYDAEGDVITEFIQEDGSVVDPFTYHYNNIVRFLIKPFELLRDTYDNFLSPDGKFDISKAIEWIGNKVSEWWKNFIGG